MKIRANRDFWIHPLMLFSSVWLLSLGLYALHLSHLLIVDVSVVKRIVMWILIPFVTTVVWIGLVCWLAPKRSGHSISQFQDGDALLQRIEQALDRWFLCWMALTIIEIIFSGGLPIFWLLMHSSKKYNDFGLPFVHVFIGTLLAVIALGKLALFLLHGGRRRLILPLFQIVWAILIVSRGLMVVALLQYLVLWLCIRRINFRILYRTVVGTILLILLFGYVGNLRSGSASAFRKLAQPTSNYPEWLPSGVLWFYIYLTSPLDNLGYTATSRKPVYDIFFPRTTYFLFPTPIRHALFGENSDLGRDSDLVSESLNVGSAYIEPYVDYGYIGIAVYSVLLGVISALAWRTRRNIRGLLLYAIIAQCLVFSVFYNYLFYNAFLGQIFWAYFIFSRKRLVVFPRTRRLVEAGSGAVG